MVEDRYIDLSRSYEHENHQKVIFYIVSDVYVIGRFISMPAHYSCDEEIWWYHWRSVSKGFEVALDKDEQEYRGCEETGKMMKEITVNCWLISNGSSWGKLSERECVWYCYVQLNNGITAKPQLLCMWFYKLNKLNRGMGS